MLFFVLFVLFVVPFFSGAFAIVSVGSILINEKFFSELFFKTNAYSKQESPDWRVGLWSVRAPQVGSPRWGRPDGVAQTGSPRRGGRKIGCIADVVQGGRVETVRFLE